jgi:predicted NAD/FAD-dependent oxidoreductase
MPSVAIIGAGCSGLSAAHYLHDAGYSVTLYEKSQGVGGRAATRQREGFIYDHGAQYIKQGSPLSVSLITERFATPDLIEIQKPVWTFDSQNNSKEGDAAQNAEPRWSYRSGISALPKRMAQGLEIHTQTHVGALAQVDTNSWQLFDDAKRPLGRYDAVLLTVPTPQAAAIVQASQFAATLPTLQHEITTQLGQAHYNPLISVMLGYQPRPQARPYYALVNTDKQHPISWLAWEHEKTPERVPPDSGLLIAQMAAQYSQDHWETASELVIRDVAQLVNALLAEALPAPYFSDIQLWRYALPTTKADTQQLNALTLPYRLAFCGDGFVGGRVHLALEHGIEVAQLLAQ